LLFLIAVVNDHDESEESKSGIRAIAHATSLRVNNLHQMQSYSKLIGARMFSSVQGSAHSEKFSAQNTKLSSEKPSVP
jgi:hypothetical protein